MPARTAMIEITTRSSINVKAAEEFLFMSVPENGECARDRSRKNAAWRDARRGVPLILGRDSARRSKSLFQFKRHRGERGKADHQRVGPALPRKTFGLEPAHVADVGAAIGFSVGVDDLAIKTGNGNAETIAGTPNRSRIHGEDNDAAAARTAHECNDAVFGIVKIDPLEAFVGIVTIPEGGLVFVDVVEMLDEPPEAIVLRLSRKLPIEVAVVIPFAALPEFAAHEKQLLAGMPVHPGEEHPQIRELLPFVAGHLVKKRALAVHDLVVAEHKNEMLRERVHERERDVVVMEAAKDRVERHVMEEVVHPTHVPFEPEPEAAEVRR